MQSSSRCKIHITWNKYFKKKKWLYQSYWINLKNKSNNWRWKCESWKGFEPASTKPRLEIRSWIDLDWRWKDWRNKLGFDDCNKVIDQHPQEEEEEEGEEEDERNWSWHFHRLPSSSHKTSNWQSNQQQNLNLTRIKFNWLRDRSQTSSQGDGTMVNAFDLI